MTPRVKYGLIVGALGLGLNICVATVFGLCGPLVALAAGALAGYFAARDEKPWTQADGAKIGAMSGAIAGALTLVGQVLGAAASLAFYRISGVPTILGTPAPTGSGPEQVGYWAAGLGFGLCLGLVGIGLGALTGAAAGYFTTPKR